MLSRKAFDRIQTLLDFVNKNLKREDIQQILFTHDVGGSCSFDHESYYVLLYWDNKTST